jgi:hypothetical protein
MLSLVKLLSIPRKEGEQKRGSKGRKEGKGREGQGREGQGREEKGGKEGREGMHVLHWRQVGMD